MVSAAVQDQISRIIRGRPPNPDQASLNKAIEWINANPSIRARVEGALPTGLSQVEKDKLLGITVFVDGQGFSVRTSDREKFIQEQIGAGRTVQFGEQIFKPAEIKTPTQFQKIFTEARKTDAERITGFKREVERLITTEKTEQRLEKAREDQGIIFLRRQELGKRITESEDRRLTEREKRATEIIKKAEKIVGIKDSGAGFIPGETAIPITIEETAQSWIDKKSSELRKLEEKRKKTKKDELKLLSLGAEINHVKSVAGGAGLFVLGLSSAVVSNVAGLAQLPSTAKAVYGEIKEDPKNIIKIGKQIPNILTKETAKAIEFFRVSPTEAVGFVAGEVLFFVAAGVGIGKGLKVAGKLGKPAVKVLRTALKGKKGTRIKILGTQGMSGDKIITKIFFTKGKKQIGGAIGTSVIKEGKVLTQSVGKVGRVGKITKKFKQKGVFIGREISISKSQRFKLVSQLKEIKSMRKLTKTEKRLFKRLRGKKPKIRLSRDLEGILQVGVGKIAQAPGTKLLRTTLRFPTGQLKTIKAKGLKIKDFVSISAVFTEKDISVIVGKTLLKKKDIIEFIGLIKLTSGRSFKSFSLGKQKLFSKALSQVVGVATASTTKSRTIIPKLSPKAQSLIARTTGITIAKAKVVIAKPILIPKIKAIISRQKKIGITQVKIKTRHATLTKQTQSIKRKQGVLAKQKQTQKVKQKQKQLVKQKQLTRQRQKLLTKQKQKLLQKQKQLTRQKQKLITRQKMVRVPRVPIIIPRIKVPIIVPIKKKKVKIPKKKLVRPRSYEVWARPLKKKGQKKPKLIKVSKVPLSKKRARDLRNYITDTSLGRTARIKLIKGKPITPKLKVPVGYAKKTSAKFRTYKIVKGKRVSLLKGRVIEKRRHLLDTIQEKKQITIRRRIAQLSKLPKRRTMKRPLQTSMKRRPTRFKSKSRTVIKKAPKGKKPTRFRFKGNQRLGFRNNKVVEIVKFTKPKQTMSSPTKRKATPTQLKNLAKGRKILAQMRKR